MTNESQTLEWSRTIVFFTIGDRYFNALKKGRIITSWALAGAKIFNPWDTQALEKVEDALLKKKRKFKKITLEIVIPL